MEPTQMKIGSNIAALRKSRGLTQEQLAQQLGVSAPAVSKWETDSSYPDITLLCPLARALGTNVDTLLQFYPTLSDEAASEYLNDVINLALNHNLQEAQNRLEDLLRQYPGCAALQYMAATTYDAFRMFFPDADEKTQIRWRDAKRELLEQLRADGTPSYWQSVTLQLAGIAITEGDLETGAALLKELPEQTADPTNIRALYFLKKDQPTEALKLTQKQLYKLAHQILFTLTTLMDPRLVSASDQLLHLSRTYQAITQAFGFPDMSDGPMIEAYLRLGQPEKAAQCFARYVDIALSPTVLPDQVLFTPGLDREGVDDVPTVPPAARRMLLQAVLHEDIYRPLFTYPQFTAALEKLKASV